jgi:hypothetical protein
MTVTLLTKPAQKYTTPQGCNVFRVVHADGAEDITLDTGVQLALMPEAKPEATCYDWNSIGRRSA